MIIQLLVRQILYCDTTFKCSSIKAESYSYFILHNWQKIASTIFSSTDNLTSKSKVESIHCQWKQTQPRLYLRILADIVPMGFPDWLKLTLKPIDFVLVFLSFCFVSWFLTQSDWLFQQVLAVKTFVCMVGLYIFCAASYCLKQQNRCFSAEFLAHKSGIISTSE